MLSIYDHSAGFSRRQFLTLGTLGLGGLSLAQLMKAQASGGGGSLLRGKSVIFLYQQGGPSQFETFDPKMEAPVETRTVTGATATSLPGVQFGDSLPKLAKLANKLTVVRSFQTGNGAHNIYPIVAPESLNANIGCLYGRVAGATQASSGVPTNAVLFPQAVDAEVTKGSARGDIGATGTFGTVYAPFIPGGTGELQKNLKLNLKPDQFEDRRAILAQLDQLNRQLDGSEESKALSKFQEQAYRALVGGEVAQALDLSKEDPKTLARYDTKQYVAADNWSKSARGKRGYYTGHSKTIGKLLLLARRLCEAGCGFVTVHAGYEGVWDMHADGNNLNMVDGMSAIGGAFDHAVAAFIEDLEARGMQDKILLVATGEMGRTPKLNKNGGRDHWGKLAPLLLYGGCSSAGRVVGRSNKDGGEPASEPIQTKHLISTILHNMFDVGQLRLQPGLAQIAKLGEIAPIPGSV